MRGHGGVRRGTVRECEWAWGVRRGMVREWGEGLFTFEPLFRKCVSLP